MKRIQWWLAAAIAWFFLLYNLERFHPPVELAPVIYVVCALAALAVVLVPTALRLPLATLGVSVVLYLVLRLASGEPLAGARLPTTVMEIVAVIGTLLVTLRLVALLEELRRAASDLVFVDAEHATLPFETGQGDLYREVRRARRFDRPLSVLSVAANGGSERTVPPALLERLRQESVERYAEAQVARMLTEETQDCDIVARRGRHFVALLPETARDEAIKLGRRLQAVAAQRLGLDLSVGLASFPDQEVTLDQLLERAEGEMRRSQSALAAVPEARQSSARERTDAHDGGGPRSGSRNANGDPVSPSLAEAADGTPARGA